MKNPPLRDNVQNLTAFQSIVSVPEPKRKTIVEKMPKKIPKKIAGPAAAAAGTQNDKAIVGKFLTRVNWTSDQFCAEYEANSLDMRNEVTNEQRLSERLGARLISMSGIPWNRQSHHRTRDWPSMITAFTVESAFLKHYRTNLLQKCSRAQQLRKDIHALFTKFARPKLVSTEAEGQEEVTERRIWEFADHIPLSDSGKIKVRDLNGLKADWKDAHTAFLKDKNDPAFKLIQSLESNPLLHCSNSGSPSGTVETLAHNLITGLAEVGIVNSGLHQYISFNSFLLDSAKEQCALRPYEH
jgi:hypothetical protein